MLSYMGFLGFIAQLGERFLHTEEVNGPSPLKPTRHANIAQLVEQLICNQ